MSVQINNHSFYQDPRFKTEKEILEKLTEICGFDTTIGVVDYFPDSPTVDIGILEDLQEDGKMPSFKKDSKITIYLTATECLMNFQNLSLEAMRIILGPLIINWIDVSDFLIDYYFKNNGSEMFKERCLENFKTWYK